MSDAQSLSTFLTVESFMLAVLSLTATLASPARERVSALPLKPSQVAWGVAGLVAVVALGAVLSWSGMYVGGPWRPWREIVVAAILLLAILAQPVFAVLMAVGMRSR